MARVLELQLQHQAFQWTPRVDLLQDGLVWPHAVQGTLESLLQHHSSKASILQCSAFFIVQLLHTYLSTGKAIPLTRRTFVGKLMSLLFNTLFRFVITFLTRSVFLFHGCSHHLQWFWNLNRHFFLILNFVCATCLTGSQFPDQGLNAGPWQWKRQILTTRPSGNSLNPHFYFLISLFFFFFFNFLLCITVASFAAQW